MPLYGGDPSFFLYRARGGRRRPTAPAADLTALTKYSLDVGDGASTSIDVRHGLGTRDVVAQIYRNSTPWDTVEPDVVHLDANTIRLTFTVAPTSAQYRIVVLALAVVSPPPPSLKSQHPRVLPPARRGTVRFFPLVGAPGNAGYQTAWIAPKISPRRAPSLPWRRGRVAYFNLVGIAGNTGYQTAWIPPIAVTRRAPSRPTRRGNYVDFPITADRSEVPDRIVSSRRTSRVFALARRGQFYDFTITPTQQPVVPPFVRQTRRPQLPTRRGFFFDFVIVGRAPGQLDALDRIKSQHPRVLGPNRRGRFQARIDAIVAAPPGTQALPPQFVAQTNRRRTFALARRGKVAFFPLVGSGLGYQTAWIPPIPSRRQPRAGALARRGQLYDFPLVADRSEVPDRIVSSRRTSRVFALARRGQFYDFTITPTQQPVVPPFVAARRRPPAVRTRSGDYQYVPSAAPFVPLSFIGKPRPKLAAVRHGHYQFVPGAPVSRTVVDRIKSRRPKLGAVRHGRYQYIPLVGSTGPRFPVCQPFIQVDINPDAVVLDISPNAVELDVRPNAVVLDVTPNPVELDSTPSVIIVSRC